MQVTSAAKGQSAFFRTNNGGYGTAWEASQGQAQNNDPAEIPQYRELVSCLNRKPLLWYSREWGALQKQICETVIWFVIFKL